MPPPESTPISGSLDALLEATEEDRWRDDPELAARLLEVAQRHVGAAVATEVIARALVEAVLLAEFSPREEMRPLVAATAAWVAETMCADGPARDRLERLWRSLQEEVAR